MSMTGHKRERPMSNTEREFLDEVLKNAATGTKRLMQGAENALVLWAVSMLILVLGWLSVAWPARVIFQKEIGWNSPVAIWVVVLGTPACAVFAVVSSVRWVSGWRDIRPLLAADLDAGRVVEELYQFTAAKRFQEPEHGGLMYFLRTTDDKVLVLYDYDSSNLGAREEDPFGSDFEPRDNLLIVRAPKTGYVISEQFSGVSLDAGDPLKLTIAPQLWPQSEAYCDIPWNELEKRLSTSRSNV